MIMIYHDMGAVLNLSSFLRYFIHLALALAPSCASQGFSAKWYPNTNLVYFAFHVAYLARVSSNKRVVVLVVVVEVVEVVVVEVIEEVVVGKVVVVIKE